MASDWEEGVVVTFQLSESLGVNVFGGKLVAVGHKDLVFSTVSSSHLVGQYHHLCHKLCVVFHREIIDDLNHSSNQLSNITNSFCLMNRLITSSSRVLVFKSHSDILSKHRVYHLLESNKI